MARTEKLERLLKLTAVLLDSARPLTAAELREHVPGYPDAGPSFNRAFERDKDDLRALGIPLKTVAVPYTDPPVDGYRIPPEDYYLPDPKLTPDELAALRFAALAVRFQGTSEAAALWKLGGLVPDSEAEAPDPLASLPSSPALIPLFGAIAERRKVTFAYSDLEREVSPWRLDYARGRWYLIGFDHQREAERNFRLDRIANEVALIGESGSATAAPDNQRTRTLKPWEIGDNQVTTVKLWVSSERELMARRQLGPEAVESPADDGVMFDVPVVNTEAFRSFVLSMGDAAEIKEPEAERALMIAWLKEMAS